MTRIQYRLFQKLNGHDRAGGQDGGDGAVAGGCKTAGTGGECTADDRGVDRRCVIHRLRVGAQRRRGLVQPPDVGGEAIFAALFVLYGESLLKSALLKMGA